MSRAPVWAAVSLSGGKQFEVCFAAGCLMSKLTIHLFTNQNNCTGSFTFQMKLTSVKCRVVMMLCLKMLQGFYP